MMTARDAEDASPDSSSISDECYDDTYPSHDHLLPSYKVVVDLTVTCCRMQAFRFRYKLAISHVPEPATFRPRKAH